LRGYTIPSEQNGIEKKGNPVRILVVLGTAFAISVIDGNFWGQPDEWW
jgi:hypothetical protein